MDFETKIPVHESLSAEQKAARLELLRQRVAFARRCCDVRHCEMCDQPFLAPRGGPRPPACCKVCRRADKLASHTSYIVETQSGLRVDLEDTELRMHVRDGKPLDRLMSRMGLAASEGPSLHPHD